MISYIASTGLKIVAIPYPKSPKRFHKKKRIQKKYIKKFGYKSALELPNKDAIYKMGDTFYCYPHVCYTLLAQKKQ